MQLSALGAAAKRGVDVKMGSANIDTRSFVHFHEINGVVMDGEFGMAMEGAFEEDLRYFKEVKNAQWAQPPYAMRNQL